jgi:hypothetical protein
MISSSPPHLILCDSPSYLSSALSLMWKTYDISTNSWVFLSLAISMAYSSHRRNLLKTSSHEPTCLPAKLVQLQLIQNPRWVPHRVSRTKIHLSTAILQLVPSNILPSHELICLMQYNKFVSCIYNLMDIHMQALCRILCYIHGTKHYSLHLYPSSTTSLISYKNACCGRCPNTRRSTFGYSVFLGDNILS